MLTGDSQLILLDQLLKSLTFDPGNPTSPRIPDRPQINAGQSVIGHVFERSILPQLGFIQSVPLAKRRHGVTKRQR